MSCVNVTVTEASPCVWLSVEEREVARIGVRELSRRVVADVSVVCAVADIRSCIEGGGWLSDKPWKDELPWKN